MDKNKIFTSHKPRMIVKKIIIATIIAMFVITSAIAIGFYTDYLEVKEIGEQFVDVFTKNITTKIIFGFAYFAFSFILVYLFTLLIKLNLKKSEVESKLFEYKLPILIVSAVIAFIASGYMGSSLYEKFLMFKNATSFGISDPILGIDVGYYII